MSPKKPKKKREPQRRETPSRAFKDQKADGCAEVLQPV